MKATCFVVLRAGFLGVLLVGCGQGLDGDDLVSQTERILAEAKPGCPVDATFNGAGEGDADSAYAEIRLETGPASNRRSVDVEVWASNMKSGYWDIQREGSAGLVAAAHRLCGRLDIGP